jgi:ABC-type transporter Mla subunit MlaD
MKFALLPFLLITATIAFGQTAPASGVTSEWDIRKLLDSLDLEAQHLKPIIDQVKPETWAAKGASSTYVAQWKAAEAELKYLLSSSEALSRQPEKLTSALDTYFRMQAMESTVSSVVEGVRKYQNPALADLLRSVLSENSASRQQLRQYLVDLAVIKEQEFKVMDEEAQRCRESISKLPPDTQPKKKSGKP